MGGGGQMLEEDNNGNADESLTLQKFGGSRHDDEEATDSVSMHQILKIINNKSWYKKTRDTDRMIRMSLGGISRSKFKNRNAATNIHISTP